MQITHQCLQNASTLVVAEHNGESVAPITYNALETASQIGGDVTAVLVGPDCSKVQNVHLPSPSTCDVYQSIFCHVCRWLRS